MQRSKLCERGTCTISVKPKIRGSKGSGSRVGASTCKTLLINTIPPPLMISLASKSIYIVSCQMGEASLLVLKRILNNIICPTNFSLILDSTGFVN